MGALYLKFELSQIRIFVLNFFIFWVEIFKGVGDTIVDTMC